jgi:mRNA-degrading endonuclease YafQ of YafQ-DinJ toxin-antitoxin module
MFHLSFSGQFKRDVKAIQKRNFDISLLKSAITELEKKVVYLFPILHTG